jgi:hypothetical protein
VTDPQSYYEKARAVALDGLDVDQVTRARFHVEQIVEDWLRQANEDSLLDRDGLVEIGLADLRRAVAGKSGAERLAALHALALKPRVQHTSAQAFELAKQVADGITPKLRAASAAERLQKQIHELMQEVKLLEAEESKRLLMRELADADLESRYVLERREGAISIRLNRHING